MKKFTFLTFLLLCTFNMQGIAQCEPQEVRPNDKLRTILSDGSELTMVTDNLGCVAEFSLVEPHGSLSSRVNPVEIYVNKDGAFETVITVTSLSVEQFDMSIYPPSTFTFYAKDDRDFIYIGKFTNENNSIF